MKNHVEYSGQVKLFYFNRHRVSKVIKNYLRQILLYSLLFLSKHFSQLNISQYFFFFFDLAMSGTSCRCIFTFVPLYFVRS